MIKEFGQITKIESDGLWVSTVQQSTCNACKAKNGCGQKLINSFGSNKAPIWVSHVSPMDLSLNENDWVEIGIEEGAVVIGSLLAYGLPIVLLVVGATLGGALPITGVVGALTGLVIGTAIAQLILHKYIGSHYFQVVLIGKASPTAELQSLNLP